jgi:serine-type D-Ala-D-Ala carboxypeptidase
MTHTPAQSGTAPLRLSFREQDRTFARAFEVLREGIALRAFPGAAVAVALNGEVVALKGFGHFTYDVTSPQVEAHSIWDLASVTKAVATTTMAMLLCERGWLDLEQSLGSILEDFGFDEERGRVTLRMLLAHSAGIPGYVKFFETEKNAQDLYRAAVTLPLEAKPGARTEYSDPGFILLGAALERIAATTLDSFCREEILQKLSMTETTFGPPESWRDRIPPTEDDHTFRRKIIQGEVNDENAWVMGGVAGHAGLFASALDVAKFAQCMLNGGAPILRRETVARFTRREAAPPDTSRALGWDTPSQPSQSGKYLSSTSFGHLGYTGTSLWCDPQRQLSVTLLTNRTWPDRSSQLIKQIRPNFHDAVMQGLGLT